MVTVLTLQCFLYYQELSAGLDRRGPSSLWGTCYGLPSNRVSVLKVSEPNPSLLGTPER